MPWAILGLTATLVSAEPVVLQSDEFARHAAHFAATDAETVVNLVPDADAWDWMRDRVPLFTCSDADVEEIYWFRWWALRKHLTRDEASGHMVFTEFITKPKPVSSALGHELMEGRWLRDQQPFDETVLYWLRGHEGGPQPHLHKYSQWLQYALWQRWMVTGDTATLVGFTDELLADYERWETSNRRDDGLFWQADVWDAMEESLSGGRHVKNVRPTISAYMAGNLWALAEITRLTGRDTLSGQLYAKAGALRAQVVQTLWDEERTFFTSLTEELERIPVREQIGFIPWYFGLPAPERGYERAWAQLKDPAGFHAPFGITTAERRDPRFRSHGVGTCEWDGAVWPFATSQTLTAMAKVLRDYPQDVIDRQDYFDAFITYTRSQRYDGDAYIGEYQDEVSGQWLKGRHPRSYWYNHSTYADLLISGVVGLRPREDNVLEIDPLLPAGTWTWFCLDNVRYRGRDITILWDRDGTKFGRGAGLRVWVDGREVAQADELSKLEVTL
ncbi:MGH1-like glycoside hydrolase domain-containing protein [Actomonas aquatica]|uniref:Glycoside hydrolase n=1 Tax=Actomonas aquatica TaxID=2866162 RepID=A0ABZ1C9R0_9BACT|nr:glycosyl hydrolase family 65 protein [Opitutus sp. WL0086]WRQ88266.1 hypothetical protein K1X11_002535 [Opitutus sp. WL0086]